MTVLSVVPANRLNMNEIRSEIGNSAISLFDFKWSDHILNDIQWLRADTFSWQSGEVYKSAYEHLVSELGETTSEATFYGWEYRGDVVYTKTDSPDDGITPYYDENGNLLGTIEIYNPPFLLAGGTAYDRDSSYDFTGPSTSYSATQKTETIGSYTVTYYLAEDGHKIVLPDMEATVQSIYDEAGVAWYYILDTDNQRFKLPRTKWGFTGLRDEVGKYVSESLPNYEAIFVNHWRDYSNGKSITPVSGAIAVDSDTYPKTSYPDIQGLSGGNYQYDQTLKISPSLSNSTYKDGATVQERATQMYLYFYVGNYTKSAIEQTAGLNSELFNNKVDLPAQKNQSDIDFVIESQLPTAENSYTWYRLYKSGWVEQGGYKAAASASANYQITLPVTMDNNKYHISKTLHGGANNSSSFSWTSVADTYSGNITNNTTKIVNINVPGTSYCIGAHWEVKGMSAQGDS